MSLVRRAVVELLGTLWLVLGGVGSAVVAGRWIGPLGVALAFGLTVLTMAYAIGHISGAHLNPAVSFGLFAAGRFSAIELLCYAAAQLLGGILGAGIILLIARGMPGGYEAAAGGLGVKGYGPHSPSGYVLSACFLTEVLLTFFFLLVILGVTSRRGLNSFSGLAIGLCLTLIHLVGIPVTDTSVNPARSTGPALFVGGWALEQLWLFWVAPLLGAALAGITSRLLDPAPPRPPA